MLIALSMSVPLRDLLLDSSQLERLHRQGTVRIVEPADLAECKAQVIVTSWESPALPASLPDTGLVAHTGGSIRRIIPRALIDSGVAVSQASSQLVPPVAEFALALTLALTRHLPAFDRSFVAGGGWPIDGSHAYGRSLTNLRIGVVGASRTGRAFIALLRGLGVTSMGVADPYLDADRATALGVRLMPLEELFDSSEVIVIHAPLTDVTSGMIGANLLRRLPDNAIVVNTARAAIMVEDAVVREARSGRLRFGLDVFDTEPLPAEHPLRGLPNVLLTPHVAGATRDARFAQGAFAVAEIERFRAGVPLHARVNAADYDQIA
jgi:phosphoglycerate dehydrogenase-like enzyme